MIYHEHLHINQIQIFYSAETFPYLLDLRDASTVAVILRLFFCAYLSDSGKVISRLWVAAKLRVSTSTSNREFSGIERRKIITQFEKFVPNGLHNVGNRHTSLQARLPSQCLKADTKTSRTVGKLRLYSLSFTLYYGSICQCVRGENYSQTTT